MTGPRTHDRHAPLATNLEQALGDFMARVVTDDVLERAASLCDMPVAEARKLIAIYANESLVGLRLIAPLLQPGLRILEVGSGVGILSAFLAETGYDIVAIEPSATGFAFMSRIAESVASGVRLDTEFRALPLMVHQLHPDHQGSFDLIYSVNVVEHIASLDEAFGAMTRLLRDDGSMVHFCPNYTVPYEPHFGIPLVPFWPAVTQYLFPSVKTRHPGLWESLNFVTARRLERLSRVCGLTMSLDEKVMANAVRRLTSDPIYRSRQNRLVAGAMTCFASLGGLRVLDALPPSWTSPMIARFRKLPRRSD